VTLATALDDGFWPIAKVRILIFFYPLQGKFISHV
jgi:hypothetical protein